MFLIIFFKFFGSLENRLKDMSLNISEIYESCQGQSRGLRNKKNKLMGKYCI